jgi:hypothetical protein
MRHQRLHHRVRGPALEGAAHLALPPSQLGGGHAGVAHGVGHVVDLAAERIERRDGARRGGGKNRKA